MALDQNPNKKISHIFCQSPPTYMAAIKNLRNLVGFYVGPNMREIA